MFSPDGKWIAFWSRGDGLVKVPVTGGTLVPLCAASMPLGATWGVDDRLVFGQPNGIMGVSASGGKCELLVATEGGEQASSPEMLPDGRTLLYSLRSGSQPWDRAVIAVQSIGGGRRKQVWDGGADAHYVSTGHLLYAVANTLFAVPFDLSRLEITGVPVPVVEGVRREAVEGDVTGSAHYAISDDGTFVYATGDRQQQRVLVWVDRQNREEPIPIQPRTYANPRISPDGRSIALTTRDAGFDVWVWDVARRNLRQLTSDAPRNYNAAWYPDSKRLAISVLYGPESGISPARQEVRVYAADGSGQPRVIPQLPPEGILSAFPASISRDERMVLHTYGPPTEDTLLFSAADASAPVRIVKAPGNERNPTISPDGHWLAYESDRTGRFEIYVSPFSNVEDGAQQVTRTGAVMPLWERDGRELYYWTETGSTMAIEAVRIVAGPSFNWEPAREIIRGRYARSHTQERQYDVWGDRFLFLKPVEGNKPPSPPRIEVVTNWFEELKRLVPGN